MKKSGVWIVLPLLMAISIILGVFLGQAIGGQLQTEEGKVFGFAPKDDQKIQRLLSLIRDNYVDTINTDALTDKAIESLMAGLDPHSAYWPPVDNAAMEEEMDGSFQGIGIQFDVVSDTIVVVAPIPGGPSERMGIRAGDRIVEIEDENVAGMGIDRDKVVKSLRGEKGTKVKVGILRRGLTKPFDVTIVRDDIPLYTVDASYMITPTTGYIRLSRFAGTSHEEVRMALDSLKKTGMSNLIFDLRGNPGGVLDGAVEIADEFLPNRQMIVYTEGRMRRREVYRATQGGSFERGDLAILIDEGSASASEIVAGAIQDHDRGFVIGRRSFGKGLVQEHIPLNDASAITLTVARYYTPSGRSIQRSYEAGADAYYQEAMDHIGALDTLEGPDSLKYETDNGRTVYGGGGIYPDIYMPMDTSYLSDMLLEVSARGLLFDFGFAFADTYRTAMLKEFPTADDFLGGRVGRPQPWIKKLQHELEAYLTKNLSRFSAQDWETSAQQIRLRALATVARNVWGNQAWYKVTNQDDPVIERALQELKATS